MKQNIHLGPKEERKIEAQVSFAFQERYCGSFIIIGEINSKT